jgi:plasmid stabilization system protein ParE
VYRVEFSPFIPEDIEEIHKYIKETLGNLKAADRLINGLLEKIEYIKKNPYARPLVNDKYLAYLGLRSIRINNYSIFYVIKENDDAKKRHIKILRFMYSRRDWINILKDISLDHIK